MSRGWFCRILLRNSEVIRIRSSVSVRIGTHIHGKVFIEQEITLKNYTSLFKTL